MKQKIMECALKVFSEKGYHMASMEDIRKETNVAKGTLYYHFAGKADLFTKIVTSGIDYLTSELVAITQMPDVNANEIIALIIRKILEYLLGYHQLARVVMNEITVGLDDSTLEAIRESKRRYLHSLAGLIGEGFKEGVIRKTDFNLAAASLTGMLYAGCEYYFNNKDSLDKEEMIGALTNMVIGGL